MTCDESMEDSKSLDKKLRKRIAHRTWAAKNREKLKRYHKLWRANCKQQLREKGRSAASQYYIRKKDKLLDILGRKCIECGFSDLRALQIDHINGRGLEDARLFGGAPGMYIYYLMRPELAKQRLQILCANCNWIKRFEKREHLVNQKRLPIKPSKNGRYLRVRAITIDDFLT